MHGHDVSHTQVKTLRIIMINKKHTKEEALKLLELIKKVRNGVDYKIDIQRSTVFLHVNNEMTF